MLSNLNLLTDLNAFNTKCCKLVSVLLCASNIKFENVAPEGLRSQNTTFRVKSLVLVYR